MAAVLHGCVRTEPYLAHCSGHELSPFMPVDHKKKNKIEGKEKEQKEEKKDKRLSPLGPLLLGPSQAVPGLVVMRDAVMSETRPNGPVCKKSLSVLHAFLKRGG